VPKGVLFSTDLLKQCRSQFSHVEECPFIGPWSFLDSASGALRLKKVSEVVAREVALPYQAARPTKGSEHIMDVIEKGEQDIRLFLGAQSGVIVPRLTATELIFELIDCAVAYYPGTNVVTTKADHPATYDATLSAAQKYDKDWRVAPFELSSGVVRPEAILDLIDENTSVLALVHGANILGSYMDVATIIREARNVNPKICVIIDAVQYAPHAPINIDNMQPDAYVIAPYKAYSRKGIAYAYISDRFSLIPHRKLRGCPANEWEMGTVDQGDYAAWSVLVDYLCWLGGHFTTKQDRRQLLLAAMNAIRSHEQALLEQLLYGTDQNQGMLAMDNVKTYCMEAGTTNRACLVPFRITNCSTNEALEGYLERHIAVSARWRDSFSGHILEALDAEDLIRVSACHYNTPQEIDAFLAATKEIASK
jgi:cysteine desulfurase/selenocysteine lyase